MKHIFLNLKRFDIPTSLGGVNSLSSIKDWAPFIVNSTDSYLHKYENVDFVQFFPEIHLLSAINSCSSNSSIKIGCQSVHWKDVKPKENFGAFTSCLTAKAAREIGCDMALIGHCEERAKLKELLKEAKCEDLSIVNSFLNKEILRCQEAGMRTLYCVGESIEEKEDWQNVLFNQISIGLNNVDTSKVVIAYEPIWSIGPGKEPASKEYIVKIARFIKERFNNIDVVYGGGLKKENAKMLASINEIDGGLIALTSFVNKIGFYPKEYLEIIDEYLGGEL